MLTANKLIDVKVGHNLICFFIRAPLMSCIAIGWVIAVRLPARTSRGLDSEPHLCGCVGSAVSVDAPLDSALKCQTKARIKAIQTFWKSIWIHFSLAFRFHAFLRFVRIVVFLFSALSLVINSMEIDFTFDSSVVVLDSHLNISDCDSDGLTVSQSGSVAREPYGPLNRVIINNWLPVDCNSKLNW